MAQATAVAIGWVEQGLVPDTVIRRGIRRLLRRRLEALGLDDPERMASREEAFVRGMNAAAIAPLPEQANAQHYELPAAFFSEVLGPRRKYSACYWPEGIDDLATAEADALRITCERAGLADGQSVLELGCGWGSLSLWMAEHYPRSRFLAVSNSYSQGAFIRAEALGRGLTNLEVMTADMNDFDTDRQFDRVVSVEMFEHMRNYRKLFGRIRRWLSPGGRFFMHIFCHRALPYAFVDEGPGDWMSRYFFSGGIMPSDDLPLRFQEDLRLIHRWRWNGSHYAKTLNAWLASMDAGKPVLWPVVQETYGDLAPVWWQRWRVFFMACAELFDYDGGREWFVSHYLFERSAN